METLKTDVLEEKDSHKNFYPEKESKILIVEDDITIKPIWEYIISTAFRSASFDWATTEPQAELYIEQAIGQGKNYDLVISDIFLSGAKTGIDLWLKFKHNLHGHFILVSGIEYFKMLRYLGTGDGLPFYLRKPLVIRECVEAVYTALNRSKF